MDSREPFLFIPDPIGPAKDKNPAIPVRANEATIGLGQRWEFLPCPCAGIGGVGDHEAGGSGDGLGHGVISVIGV